MKPEHQRDMMRPRSIIERLNADGIGGLTEYALYRLLKTGAIPARKPGRCYLVSYANVLDYLRCTDGGDIAPPPSVAGYTGIRRANSWEVYLWRKKKNGLLGSSAF